MQMKLLLSLAALLAVVGVGADQLKGTNDEIALIKAAVQRYAPVVRLHPADQYRPSSAEWFFENTRMMRKVNGKHEKVSEKVDLALFEKLREVDTTDYYMQLKSVDARKGPALKRQGDKLVTDNVPMYVHVRRHNATNEGGAYVTDIQYWFYYPYNGDQAFRVGIRCNPWRLKTRTFGWGTMGRHEGDWEHVTVRLTRDLKKFGRIYLSQHGAGKGEWLTSGQFQWAGSHPVLYSSFHSHATYSHFRTKTVDVFPRLLLAPTTISWLKFVDTTDAKDTLVQYDTEKTGLSMDDVVEWVPNKLVYLSPTFTDELPKELVWVTFKGHWGMELDNRALRRPPPLPCTGTGALRSVGGGLTSAMKFAGIKKKLFVGKAPRSPPHQGMWSDSTSGGA